MFKHTESFKNAVVQEYLKGVLGFKRVAALHGVDAPAVRLWVASYKAHGADGLRRKVQRYDRAFKVSVLRHMWENAWSYNQAAAFFNVRNPTSISSWEDRYREGGIDAISPPRRKADAMKAPTAKPDPKPDEQKSREDLLKEVEYLRMENEVLKKLEALAQARKSSGAKKRS